MRAVVIPRPGGYPRLELRDVPAPVPSRGEVRVVCAAIGVNYADCVVRMGLYASAREFVGWPITPGFEVAGTVDAVGPDVEGVKEGDAVFAVTRFGGYASHVVVPRNQVFPLPEGWSMARAAGFPVVHLTAWYALCELARPRRGSIVLVHSAAGGVGGALVQLARWKGCRVVGVVGARHKVSVARELGADVIIDKSYDDLWTVARREAPGGYDAIFDANGVSTLRHSYAHLGSPGRLVVYGFHSMLPREGGLPSYPRLAWDYVRTPRFDPLKLTNENRSVMGFNLSYLFARKEVLAEGMEEMLRGCSEGAIGPQALTEFPLERVADAHRALESGLTVGKVVLTVAP